MGVYMHPNFEKYRAVSHQLHELWNAYASAAETIALDEAYLDVTEKAISWENACEIARTIKRRTRDELGLTCSVGVAYSKTAAKTASEEKKPDGYFEIPTEEDFVSLIQDRDVRVLYTVGKKTAEKLNRSGIRTTFQEDVEDYDFLKDVLLLLSISVERRAARVGLYGEGVTLKITYADMKSITRSRLIPSTRSAADIYEEAASLLDRIARKPVRLIGTGIYHLTDESVRQLRFDDYLPDIKKKAPWKPV